MASPLQYPLCHIAYCPLPTVNLGVPTLSTAPCQLSIFYCLLPLPTAYLLFVGPKSQYKEIFKFFFSALNFMRFPACLLITLTKLLNKGDKWYQNWPKRRN